MTTTKTITKTERKALENWQSITKRERNIMLNLYRMHRMTTKQISQIWYTYGGEVRTKSQDRRAQEKLQRLEKMGFCYRVDPKGIKVPKKTRSAIWVPGKAMKHVLPYMGYTVRTGHLYGPAKARNGKPSRFAAHDLGVIQALADLCTQENEWVNLNAKNMFGARHLASGYYDRTDPTVRPLPVNVWHDCLTSLTVTAKSGQTTEIPFIVEWDTGHKNIDSVAEQVIKGAQMAKSGRFVQKFPMLQVNGYQIPQVYILQGMQRSSQSRLRGLLKRLPADLGSVYITTAEQWEKGAYTTPLIKDSSGAEHYLIEALYKSSLPLIREGAIMPGRALKYIEGVAGPVGDRTRKPPKNNPIKLSGI